MDKHLLVTVGNDNSAMSGVHFVSGFIKHKEAVRLTLFHTARSPRSEFGDADADELQRQLHQIEQKGKKAAEAAVAILSRAGFVADNLDTKMSRHHGSTALDIIKEAEDGQYDCVVLGRRGVSWLEEAMGESVSKEFMDKKLSFPFWVCRQVEADRRNVLLCVDSSAPSYNIVDHTGFMLGKDGDHGVTLLRIVRSDGASKIDPELIFEKSRALLLENGMPPEKIRSKVIQESNVAKAIMAEADKGAYAAVGLGTSGAGQGKSGLGKTFFKKLFMGSVSSTLFRDLTGAALWISH